MANISELEGVALGIIARRQPCTAYAVRKLLKDSPSSHWRGSAGSIYPLLDRLEGQRFIVAEVDPGDGRGRRLLRMTRAGREALEQWILQGSAPDVAAGVSDHVRTRFFFLGLLSRKQRERYVAATATALEHFREATEHRLAQIDRSTDPFGWFACQNAMLQAQARAAWIRQVQAAVEAGEFDPETAAESAVGNGAVAF